MKNSLQNLRRLDPFLTTSWVDFDAYFLDCLRRRSLREGFELLAYLEPSRFQMIAVRDYSYYAAAFHSLAHDFEQTLQDLHEAHRYGYSGFWRFDPLSHGWGINGLKFDEAGRRWINGNGQWIHQDDPYQVYEKHRFLEALYSEPKLLKFVRSVYNGRVEPWGFQLNSTPFCWVEQGTLGRSKATCLASGSALAKDAPVYSVRFFNGSFDVSTDPFYIGVSAGNASTGFLSNKSHYESDSYTLNDFRFKVSYTNSAHNAFWNNLEQFNLVETLHMIADPPSSPTPYELISLTGQLFPGEPPRIHSGTGGQFLNLLWCLVKCGYYREIADWLPKAPPHFPMVLLLFDRPEIWRETTGYLKIPDLMSIRDILFQRTVSPEDIASLVRFGKAHPTFQKQLAESLVLYEYHLYSNYHPGANWFYWEFRHLIRGHGGRWLYLLASHLELLPIFRKILETKALPRALSVGAWDAYDNSISYIYQTLLIGLAMRGQEDLYPWRRLGAHRSERLIKIFDHIPKVMSKIR